MVVGGNSNLLTGEQVREYLAEGTLVADVEENDDGKLKITIGTPEYIKAWGKNKR